MQAYVFLRTCMCVCMYGKTKVKQSLYRHITGPEGYRKLRLPDFETIDTWSGKVVSLMHRPPLPPRKCTYKIKQIYFIDRVEPRAMLWPKTLGQWKIPVTIWIGTRDLPAYSAVSQQTAPPRALCMCACMHAACAHAHYAANWIWTYIAEELKLRIIVNLQVGKCPQKVVGCAASGARGTGGGNKSVVDVNQMVKRDVGVGKVCQRRPCMSCSDLLILSTCRSLYLFIMKVGGLCCIAWNFNVCLEAAYSFVAAFILTVKLSRVNTLQKLEEYLLLGYDSV